jgi:hypothetical protein
MISSLAAQGVLLMSMIRTPITINDLVAPIPHTEIDDSSLQDVLTYIDGAWDTLTRATDQCQSLEDTKTDSEAIVYLPAGMAIPQSLSKLQASCRVRIEHLPAQIKKVGEFDASKIQGEGLLYLENPYVVPGGQFNEMYGWDSYFIVRGLIRDHRLELAKGMVENFFFEIEHYGGVLNANRTYYLTRSQPPFLTSAITKSGMRRPIWREVLACLGITIMAMGRCRKLWAIPASITVAPLIFFWLMSIPRNQIWCASESTRRINPFRSLTTL